jgi:hypothetical protein
MTNGALAARAGVADLIHRCIKTASLDPSQSGGSPGGVAGGPFALGGLFDFYTEEYGNG